MILIIFFSCFNIQGVLAESDGVDSHDHVFTLVEAMIDNGRTGGSIGTCEELMAGDEDGERAVASAEDQLLEEMTVYEVLALYGCILIYFHFPSHVERK